MVTICNYLPYRSKLKQEANKCHEQEKDSWPLCRLLVFLTALEVDDTGMDKYTLDEEPDNLITFATCPTVV